MGKAILPSRPLPAKLNEELRVLGLGFGYLWPTVIISTTSMFFSQFVPTDWAVFGFPLSGVLLFIVPSLTYIACRYASFHLPRGCVRARLEHAFRPRRYAPHRKSWELVPYLIDAEKLPRKKW